MKSHWKRRFWKLRRTFIFVGLERRLPPFLSLLLSPFFSLICSENQNPNPRNMLNIFSLGTLPAVVFISTLRMLTFSKIIAHAGWVTVHELSCCTTAGHCRSSCSATDHLQLRGLLHPDHRKELNTFKALEVTVYPKGFWATWNKLGVGRGVQCLMDGFCVPAKF